MIQRARSPPWAPNSSPSTPSPGRSSARRLRRACSTALSASVTGVRSGLVQVASRSERKWRRVIWSARSASCSASARSSTSGSPGPGAARRDPDRDGEALQEALRGVADAEDGGPVLLQVVGGRLGRAELGGALDGDDVAATPVAVQVQRDAGVGPEVADLLGGGLAVDQEGGAVPPEPHRGGLRLPVGADGGDPDDQLGAQALVGSGACGRGQVEHGLLRSLERPRSLASIGTGPGQAVPSRATPVRAIATPAVWLPERRSARTKRASSTVATG